MNDINKELANFVQVHKPAEVAMALVLFHHVRKKVTSPGEIHYTESPIKDKNRFLVCEFLNAVNEPDAKCVVRVYERHESGNGLAINRTIWIREVEDRVQAAKLYAISAVTYIVGAAIVSNAHEAIRQFNSEQ